MALFSFMQTISFIYLFFVFTFTVASLSSNDDDCLALFRFKQSIFDRDDASFDDTGGFQKFESWRKISSNVSDNRGFDCCLWDGVECSNDGYVIGLDLSLSFLHGRVDANSSLFHLVHLQKLNLSMNDFGESRIPSEIGRLTQLRILDLSNSSFNGQIPNEISHLVKLFVLDLSWNPLKLQDYSLGYLLQNMTLLEELHLSGVDISSSVPRFLANLSSLTSIFLEDRQLQDEFPSPIFHLPRLKYLSMAHNPNLTGSLPEFGNYTLLEHLDLFSTGFAGIIPESINRLNHLVFLRLTRCHFSGHIPRLLSNMTQLTHLGLGQNDLSDVVPSLVSLSKLIVLDLSYNTFENGSLPYWLSKLTSLNELNLNFMNISDKIPSSFANLTKLRVLAMSGNFIHGRIPSSILNHTQLVSLELSENQLQGPVSSAFSNFKSLEMLSLHNNNFSGRVYLDTFTGLVNLERLHLGNNRISFVTTNNYTKDTLPNLRYLGLASSNLKQFPGFLRFQNKMMGLFLDRNKIEGLVPVWIWNNSKETLRFIEFSNNFITGFHQHPQILPGLSMESFDISYNQLRGWLPIPPRTTKFYDVSNNKITGEISPLICELKSLRVLHLSSNNMNGTLPPCLGHLSNSLFTLDLKRNNFHGQMMNTFTHGSRLKTIDLSENKFVGPVSKSLSNCTNLEVLALGDNSFNDVFPFWLGHIAKLQVLILRSNKFYGDLQGPSSGNLQFSKLRILDLSNNGFSGSLPDNYFKSWNAMKVVSGGKSFAMNSDMEIDIYTKHNPYSMTLTNKGVKTEYEKILNIFTAIDLACNNLEGKIPLSLQDLQALESLNLSNNHLAGPILPSFGNLKNLESLDLSQNKLSGEIPQQLLQLGFLSILNVSFNHLNGPIPQGKQFNTFENNSYIGNPRLCGEPLSKECQNSKRATLPPTKGNESMFESLLPGDIIDWIVIFTGFTSGLVIGNVVGNILYARYSDWFIEIFGLQKDKWVRPLTNTKRNYVLKQCNDVYKCCS